MPSVLNTALPSRTAITFLSQTSFCVEAKRQESDAPSPMEQGLQNTASGSRAQDPGGQDPLSAWVASQRSAGRGPRQGLAVTWVSERSRETGSPGEIELMKQSPKEDRTQRSQEPASVQRSPVSLRRRGELCAGREPPTRPRERRRTLARSHSVPVASEPRVQQP